MNMNVEEKKVSPKLMDNFVNRSSADIMNPNSYEWKNTGEQSPVRNLNSDIQK